MGRNDLEVEHDRSDVERVQRRRNESGRLEQKSRRICSRGHKVTTPLYFLVAKIFGDECCRTAAGQQGPF